MTKALRSEDWHIPLSCGDMSLQAALDDMGRVGDAQSGIPFLIQLVENPKYKIPGVDLFHGAVDLRKHDCIHILLGRGTRTKDEAFVIGFTMGSTNRVGRAEEALYSWIAQNLYPGIYRFEAEDIAVFRDALKLGFISTCRALDMVDYDAYLAWSLSDIRRDLGLEEDLLSAYYQIEKKRYAHSVESQRLV
jgi:hypothetical protein